MTSIVPSLAIQNMPEAAERVVDIANIVNRGFAGRPFGEMERACVAAMASVTPLQIAEPPLVE